MKCGVLGIYSSMAPVVFVEPACGERDIVVTFQVGVYACVHALCVCQGLSRP